MDKADIDIIRLNDGQYYTVYFRQGDLVGNILVPQEVLARQRGGFIEKVQEYLDAHATEFPNLKDLPNIEQAETVTIYLVKCSLTNDFSMVFVERNDVAPEILIAELHELDAYINSFTDVIKNLEEERKMTWT